MANAQNFFNATPAPDPRQNPIMAGLAGGLQGGADQGEYQKQLAMTMYQNQQKQLTDAMSAGIQNHQAGFGQGPDGSTPMQFAGQQAYWDPNGMSPAGQMDMSKSALYQQMTQNKEANPEAQAMAHTLLTGIANKYAQDATGKYGLDKFQGDVAASQDFVNQKYGIGKYAQKDTSDDTSDDTPPATQTQPFNGRDASGKPLMATAAQAMFSKATGQSTQTPRSKQLTAQLAQDFLRQAGGDKNKARAIAKQQGFTF